MLTDPFFRTAQALVIDGNASMRRAVLAQRKRSANPILALLPVVC